MREAIRFTFIGLAIIAISVTLIKWPVWGFSFLGLFLFSVGFYDIFQRKHAILRNFPVIGHIRYLLEMISPEIHQYFIEKNTEGKPIDRNHRDYVYSRAKGTNQTHPFGTELDVTQEGYIWMQHSIYPAGIPKIPPRVRIGGPHCSQPYSASIFNISAMSYGSLSKNAVKALNLGAKEGGFFHNTGEGGISDYHLLGGDLVYEVGTGYFGCRDEDGNFSPGKFAEKATLEQVKMIEIKISQGAKPGHGGILPAAKNNEEIAKIRGVKPHTDVLSPPGHKKFSDAAGLIRFIQELRELSGGKPIGFKLCIGDKSEFDAICREMLRQDIFPDFITVDGGEGGTGAAPIDFSNYVGMPWEEALLFVTDTLRGYDLKKHIKVLTATKILTAFDIFKALAIGADICNSARGMMLALGCIQALKCDTNRCPSGVATNNKALARGLDVEDKWKRVANYHIETVKDFLALYAAAGCSDLEDINRTHICKKQGGKVFCYNDLFPEVNIGQYLNS